MASETTPPGQPEAPAIPGVTRWRKRATVEAIQWCGHNLDDVQLFCGTLVYPATMTEGPAFKVEGEDPHAVVWVARRGMWEWVPQGCWIVSEPHGKGQALTPVAADVFAATYEPAPGPLVMPADESAALRTVTEAAGEQPWTPEEIAEFKASFEATMARYAPLRVLPSDHWKARAEAAEAKLAEVRAVLLEGGQDAGTVRRRALAVTGSEEGRNGLQARQGS